MRGAPEELSALPHTREATMIRVRHAIIVTTGVVGLITSALAADMTGAEIKTLVAYSSADTMSSSTDLMELKKSE
jgi:NADH:ubiquinone oxidoreductase subunit 4 (subunit M)